MAQQPHIQRKAQEEVDAVVGGRPPKCSDRECMPYLEAVIKEVFRCNPVLPIGMSCTVFSSTSQRLTVVLSITTPGAL